MTRSSAKARSTLSALRCSACGHTTLRSRLACGSCGSNDLKFVSLTGHGQVIAVSQTSAAGFQVVQLELGLRVLVVGPREGPAVGSEIWIELSAASGIYTAVAEGPR